MKINFKTLGRYLVYYPIIFPSIFIVYIVGLIFSFIAEVTQWHVIEYIVGLFAWLLIFLIDTKDFFEK